MRLIGILALAIAVAMGCGSASAEAERRLLVAAGAPTVNEGVVRKGGDILTVPVRHGMTATLKNDLRLIGGWSKRPPLLAGQPLYGVPMRGQTHWTRPHENFVVWCAPRRAPGKTGRQSIEAYCLAPRGSSVEAFEARNPLLESRIETDRMVSTDDPQIEEGPADIGFPMTAAYRVVNWRRDRATLRLYIRSERGDDPVTTIDVPRLGDGAALVQLLGGVLALVPADDGAVEVRVLKPLTGEGDLGV